MCLLGMRGGSAISEDHLVQDDGMSTSYPEAAGPL